MADDLLGQRLQAVRVFAVNLDAQFALHAGDSFVHIVLDVLAELKFNAGNLRKLSVHGLAKRVAGSGGFPIGTVRIQFHVAFHHVEPVDVRAVIRPAQLGDDRS